MKNVLKKKMITLLLVTALAVGAVACGSQKATTETAPTDTSSTETTASEVTSTEATEATTQEVSEPAELRAFRIGIPGSAGAGVYENSVFAVTKGYFEEELAEVGFYPEFIYFTGAGPEMNEAFAGKNLDAAVVGDFPVITAKSNGIDNKIIAITNQKVNYSLFTTVPEASSIHDLYGKTAVVFAGSVAHFFWQQFLDKEGVEQGTLLEINSTDAGTLLASGDAQVYPITGYVGYLYELSGLGHNIDVSASDIWTTFTFEVTSELLNENPELGVAVNKALIRSSKYAQENPEEFYDALGTDTIPSVAWSKYYSADPTLSNLSPEITDEILTYYAGEIQWMSDHGVIINPVEVSDLVDTSYYQKAVEELNK